MNAAGRPSKIHLIGEGRYEEGQAAGILKPGHLLRLTTGGSASTEDSGRDRRLLVHNEVGGPCEAMFATEDALQGKTIDDAYAIGDRVFYVIANKGDVVQALLSGGEITNIGSYLVSNGDGTLQVEAGSDAGQARIAVALEAVDQSSSDEVDSWVKCRIL
jgi:hypothetical protein